MNREVPLILSARGPLTKGATVKVKGQSAIELKEAAKLYTGALYVATTGQPYPLLLRKSGRETGQTTFTRLERPRHGQPACQRCRTSANSNTRRVEEALRWPAVRTSSSASSQDGARERLGPDSLSARAEDTRSIRGVASDTDPSSGATRPVGDSARAGDSGVKADGQRLHP